MKECAFSLRLPELTHPYRVSNRMHQALINVNDDPNGRYNPISMKALRRLGLVTYQDKDSLDVQGGTRRGTVTARGRAVLGGVRDFTPPPITKHYSVEPDWTGPRCDWCTKPNHTGTPWPLTETGKYTATQRLCESCVGCITRNERLRNQPTTSGV